MRFVVLIKQVPETTNVQIDPETNTLKREGIENVVNPFDTYALEEGVRLRERFSGKVTVISMGPPQAEEMLREAISCGADEAILISDRAFAGSDTLATSYTLSCAVNKIGDYDLVICGRQTIDGDTGQVGPELSEALGLPFVAYVSKVNEVADGKMVLEAADDAIVPGRIGFVAHAPGAVLMKSAERTRVFSITGSHIPNWAPLIVTSPSMCVMIGWIALPTFLPPDMADTSADPVISTRQHMSFIIRLIISGTSWRRGKGDHGIPPFYVYCLLFMLFARNQPIPTCFVSAKTTVNKTFFGKGKPSEGTNQAAM